MKTNAIILAGGKSSRMGENKALLTLGENTVIQHIISELDRVFDSILISSNEVEDYVFLGKKIIPDLIPNKGPLSGIHAGLNASSTDINFVIACDMPFPSKEIAEYFVTKSKEGYDLVLPKVGGKFQPLYGVYRKSLIPLMEHHLLNDNLKLMSLIESSNSYIVGEEELTNVFNPEAVRKTFYNMNYPEEYKEAQHVYAKREGEV